MAEKSATSAKRNRGPGRPFEKGVSGNPGGRPAGVAALREYIAEKTEGGTKLADFHLTVAFEPTPVLAGPKGPVELEPTLKERQDSVAWLADRLWGKAIQSAEVSSDDGSPLAFTIVRKVAG